MAVTKTETLAVRAVRRRGPRAPGGARSGPSSWASAWSTRPRSSRRPASWRATRWTTAAAARCAGGAAGRDPAGPAADLRGPGAGHPGHRAGADRRLHDRERAGPGPGRRRSGWSTSSRSTRSRARAPASRSRGGSDRRPGAAVRCRRRRQPGRRGPARGAGLAGALGFDETDAGKVALVVTEAGDQPRQARAAGARSSCRARSTGRPAGRGGPGARPRPGHGRRRPLPARRLLHRRRPGHRPGRDAPPRRPASTSTRVPGQGTALLARLWSVAPGRSAGDRARDRRRSSVPVAGRGGLRRRLGDRATADGARPCSSPTGWATVRRRPRPRGRPSRRSDATPARGPAEIIQAHPRGPARHARRGRRRRRDRCGARRGRALRGRRQHRRA